MIFEVKIEKCTSNWLMKHTIKIVGEIIY